MLWRKINLPYSICKDCRLLFKSQLDKSLITIPSYLYPAWWPGLMIGISVTHKHMWPAQRGPCRVTVYGPVQSMDEMSSMRYSENERKRDQGQIRVCWRGTRWYLASSMPSSPLHIQQCRMLRLTLSLFGLHLFWEKQLSAIHRTNLVLNSDYAYQCLQGECS